MGVRRQKIGRILLRGESYRGGSGPCTVTEVMPADADARAEEHSDNPTEAAGSQLRCVHGRAWSFTQRQCRQNASNQRITRAAEGIALPNIMRSGVKA